MPHDADGFLILTDLPTPEQQAAQGDGYNYDALSEDKRNIAMEMTAHPPLEYDSWPILIHIENGDMHPASLSAIELEMLDLGWSWLHHEDRHGNIVLLLRPRLPDDSLEVYTEIVKGLQGIYGLTVKCGKREAEIHGPIDHAIRDLARDFKNKDQSVSWILGNRTFRVVLHGTWEPAQIHLEETHDGLTSQAVPLDAIDPNKALVAIFKNVYGKQTP